MNYARVGIEYGRDKQYFHSILYNFAVTRKSKEINYHQKRQFSLKIDAQRKMIFSFRNQFSRTSELPGAKERSSGNSFPNDNAQLRLIQNEQEWIRRTKSRFSC